MSQAVQMSVTSNPVSILANTGLPENATFQTWNEVLTYLITLPPDSGVKFSDTASAGIQWNDSASTFGALSCETAAPTGVTYTRVSDLELEMVIPTNNNASTGLKCLQFSVVAVPSDGSSGTYVSTNKVTLLQGFRSQHTVTATVSGTGTYSIANDANNLSVPTGATMVVQLNLAIDDSSDATAKFPADPSNAFAWQGNEPAATYTRQSNTQVTLTETNINISSSDRNFGFHSTAEVAPPPGTAFSILASQDPTLINRGTPITTTPPTYDPVV